MKNICALCGYALDSEDLDKGYCSLCGADCESNENRMPKKQAAIGKRSVKL